VAAGLDQPSRLHCHSNGLEERFAIKRFCEEFGCTCSHCLKSHLFVTVRSDEDRWNLAMIRVQLRLEVKPRHPWHPDIGDQTARLVLLARVQEILGGGKRLRGKTSRFQQTLDRESIRLVVFDNCNHLHPRVFTHTEAASIGHRQNTIIAIYS
jgi:hypothetical protein